MWSAEALFLEYSLIVTAMAKQRKLSDASVHGVPVEVPSPGPLPGTSLATLPIELRDDISRRAIQLGAGGGILSRTCRAFSKTNLLHAPALHIQLDSQGCDQFLTPRVVAALQARTCKLVLTLEQQRAQSSRQYIRLLTEVLQKLASCAAVETCKLGTSKAPSFGPLKRLGCTPDLAQYFVDGFPGLTSLSLHNCAIPCNGLAALLSHPQLSLQLQQLDLSNTTITQAERPEPGAATLDNLFHASSLSTNMAEGGNNPLLPNLQPLSQHLTQLCIRQRVGVLYHLTGLDEFTAALQPLAQLQVLTMFRQLYLEGQHLPGLLQALPRLHTLQLPGAAVKGQEQLDALLAATQLTSIQLKSLMGLTSSRADVPCRWQRLELTGFVDCATVAYLPLNSLTQPLVLGALAIVTAQDDDCDLVAAAVHNVTQACKVPVRVKVLRLITFAMPAQQHVKVQQLVAELQALERCSWDLVSVAHMNVEAANVATLAPSCQGCTHLKFVYGSVTPSLEYWRQLVQLMPTVADVVFEHVLGSTSSAMCESLQLMIEQPWARWLDICICRCPVSSELPACWLANDPSKSGKLRLAGSKAEGNTEGLGRKQLQLGKIRQCDAHISGVPVQAPSAEDVLVPATTLLKLPPDLLDDIAHLVKGRETLARTCFDLFKAGLLHAPSLRLQLDRQCCDRLLSPRVVAALRSRKCKLAITLELPREQGSRLLAEVLEKLGICTAVNACKLSSLEHSSLAPPMPMECSRSLAQCLVNSFPSLTSLALHGYSIPCSDLASLLSHPRLSLQLQQLDLSSSTILQPEQPEPGAVTLANVFHAANLKQLSLLLCLQQGAGADWRFDKFTAALAPLAQLQVLTISNESEWHSLYHLEGLPKLLQALPQLHTLQLPHAEVLGVRLATLLAATQITSIQLGLLDRLTSSHADAPCSWQRLELTFSADCATAAYLPLHTLTQPLMLGTLHVRKNSDLHLVAAAVHNLTQTCKVPVRINVLRLDARRTGPQRAEQQVELQQLAAVLQALNHCSWGVVYVAHMIVAGHGSPDRAACQVAAAGGRAASVEALHLGNGVCGLHGCGRSGCCDTGALVSGPHTP
ncbi:hypothetical protein QJQ45_026595 [Haematococcus lacustris]|nr:hypothetical protein QJQ45_026595 [Haematococcus lacustris]